MDAVSTFQDLAKRPELVSANVKCLSDNAIIINSSWHQRLIPKNEKQTIHRSHTVDRDQLRVISCSDPYLNDESVWKVQSPSGKWLMYMRKHALQKGKTEEHCYFELWSGSGYCDNVIDVSAAEKHGVVYDKDGAFGSLVWSCDETKVAYVAEKKKPESISYFAAADSKAKSSSTATVRGEKFVYQEDWGEQLVGKYHPVICILDLKSGDVTVVDDLPDSSSGQVVWCPDSNGIIFCSTVHTPIRLGITHCPIRRSFLYHYDLETKALSILNEDVDSSVRSPRFSPDGKQMAYLECSAGGPHAKSFRLKLMDWSSRSTSTLVDIIGSPENEAKFQGLYNPDLAMRCWSVDSSHIFLSSPIRSQKDIFSVDVKSGLIRKLTDVVGTWSVLDVLGNIVIASFTSFDLPPQLVVGRAHGVNGTHSVDWVFIDQHPPISGITWSVHQHVPTVPHPKYPSLTYESIVVRPSERESRGLIVFPHGGPHTAFTVGYQIYFAGLVKLGFTVALVNYRGSTGFGEDSINSLVGHIGENDVSDVQQVAHEVLELYKLDKDKVVALGGSHGGFLVAHLIGQFPDFYKAAVMRNPVTNMVAKIALSDIPDWGHVEVGMENFMPGTIPDLQTYSKLYSMSPVAHINQVKTPTMVMLGEDDRRVPPCLGIEFHKALLAKGVESRLMMYPGNGHPIKTVEAESDSFVNLCLWFHKHLQ